MPDNRLADLQEAPFDWLHTTIVPRFINIDEEAGSFIEQLSLIQEFAGLIHIRTRRSSE
ncbi:MAG: hypothetical protein ACYDGO_10640 [Smithellaceae bacterium]